jgi:hypothetical protein
LFPRHKFSVWPLLFSSHSYGIPLANCPTWPLTNTSLAQCRNSTVIHLSSGSGQLLLGPTTAMGSSLLLSAALYSQMLILISVLQHS